MSQKKQVTCYECHVCGYAFSDKSTEHVSDEQDYSKLEMMCRCGEWLKPVGAENTAVEAQSSLV